MEERQGSRWQHLEKKAQVSKSVEKLKKKRGWILQQDNNPKSTFNYKGSSPSLDPTKSGIGS